MKKLLHPPEGTREMHFIQGKGVMIVAFIVTDHDKEILKKYVLDSDPEINLDARGLMMFLAFNGVKTQMFPKQSGD